HSDVSLREDARQPKAFLASLVGNKPVPALLLSLTSEQHCPDKDGMEKLNQKDTHTIDQESYDKDVLALPTDLQYSRPVNSYAMMASSRRLNLNCYHFFMAFSADTAFLGSSPERLWRRRETALRTEALGGTVANHPDNHKAWQLGDWLMKDDKNPRENMLVVVDI
ncbi:chorismate-binding protein, partial [Salmonella enterica]|uniref:chorismate-binding protein n=1 Tax=Salmonella enterica TaxID=28901 RepID=UPI003F4B13CD